MLKKRQNEVKRNIFLFDEKKHNRTSPDVQFQEFSLTKQISRPRTDYQWIGKTIQKKNPKQKNEKTVKIKVKLPHVNKKPPARKRIFVQTPFSHSNLNLEQNSRRKTSRFFAPLPVSA